MLTFSAFWAFLPGGVGMANFRKTHHGLIAQLGHLCWWILLLVHPLALYKIGFTHDGWLWLAPVAVMQVLFFAIFGRNVSTL
ncbi:hypothetical protein PY254_02775 [Rhodanobacter sp. AS-Z3]|uniref:hypothetical protein n=1 Tax=Rhodanobacter sp. AS-Z3 TaxID=3031330 RepID=UPI00247AB890|nr:hypothetical protein [Rhodanobacter sp. AS-Z3]WEN15617.1 hypothetical protein PY254_02775 [Rhodanobacter sp. AS-Z3]